MKMKKMLAFTLAEVLITLSILGVVAAITVPSLVKRNEERSTVTKVLKAYSTLAHAFDVAVAENGPITRRYGSNVDDSYGNWVTFLKYMNTTKLCTKNDDNGCFATNNMTGLTGAEDYAKWAFGQRPSALLKDGSALIIWSFDFSCKAGPKRDRCAIIMYDVNGPKKGPNWAGKDIFYFELTENGIRPNAEDSAVGGCDKTDTSSMHNGGTCANYIVKNRNMNYLH